MINIALYPLGTPVYVLTSTVYKEPGILVEKSAKTCKIKWPDGNIGMYDYDKNDFLAQYK